MKRNKLYLLTLFLLSICFACNLSYGQRVLTLDEAISLAKEQSFEFEKTKNKYLQAKYQYKIYKSSYLPKLSLSGTIPSFNRSISKITLPNGDEAFVTQSMGTYSGMLSLNQPIPFLGSDLTISSGLQRLDLYSGDKSTSYLANVINVGISKSIFGYNQYKWQDKIEPLQYQQEKISYIESLENISKQTVDLYFSLLSTQISKNIQEQNKINNDTILNIIKERYKVGKCTEDEVLQLEVNSLNIELQLQQLDNDIKDKEKALKDFLRMNDNETIILQEPSLISLGLIDSEKAYKQALDNSALELSQKRQLIEAQSNLARIKSENTTSFDLYATFGLSKNDAELKQAYKNPLNQEVITLGFNIPIVDFGTRKNRIKQAQLRVSDATITAEQEKLNFKREISNTVNQINTLSNKLNVIQKTNELSSKRYEMAKTRYINGKIGFLDYSNAEYERNNSKLDYIETLKNNWTLYYEIRQKTLYDFKSNRKIDLRINDF